MLDELRQVMPLEKGMDLLRRLENKRVDQALPAEMELGLLWALSKLGEMDIEPEWWGDSSRPDAVTDYLLPSRLTAIEIAAVTDNAISGEELMDRVALQITDFSNTLQKGSGQYLYFTFGGTQAFENGRSVRRRLAPEGYLLSEAAKNSIREWISSGGADSGKLTISEPGLHIVVERRGYKQVRYHNVFSSIPPEAYSIDDNPLYALLKRKLAQLKAAPSDTVRIIIVADVGSTLLRRIGTFGEKTGPGGYHFSGTDIISHFIRTNSARIDAVAVFTPHRKRINFHQDDLQWAGHCFAANRALRDELIGAVKKLAASLPKPHFEGYQARSLFQQGAFSPTARGWYLGVKMTSRPGQFQVSIPARAFLDLLAGRITPQQFSYALGDRPNEKNLFKGILDRGETLSAIEMAPRDVDADDDHIVFHFSDDPAARKLKVKAPHEADE